MSDGNTPITVDDNVTTGDTDDLTAFEALYYGKAKPEEEIVETDEEVEDTSETVEEAEEEDAEPEEEGDEPESEEEAEEDEVDEPEPEPKKNRVSAKERINQLVAEKNAEKEARLALERRLADLEARVTKEEPKPEVKTEAVAPDKDVPDPDAVDDKGELIYPLGEFDPKYIADLTRHTIRKEAEALEEKRRIEAEEAAAKQKRDELTNQWTEKLTEKSKEIPDLKEKLVTLDTTFGDLDPVHGMYLAETIMQMERGPEVLYYLANNIDEARKIVASDPVVATIALGRLEGILSAQTAKKESNNKKVSKAPAPPVATRGSGAKVTVPPDTDDLDAFEKVYFRR